MEKYAPAAEGKRNSPHTPTAPVQGQIAHSGELSEPVASMAPPLFFPRYRNTSFALHSVHFHGKNPRRGSTLVSRKPFLRNRSRCLQPQFEQCIFLDPSISWIGNSTGADRGIAFQGEACCRAFILSRMVATHRECPQAEKTPRAEAREHIKLC